MRWNKGWFRNKNNARDLSNVTTPVRECRPSVSPSQHPETLREKGAQRNFERRAFRGWESSVFLVPACCAPLGDVFFKQEERLDGWRHVISEGKIEVLCLSGVMLRDSHSEKKGEKRKTKMR
ncbi:hypothetical protein U14_01899 [Candidatus Moduliflexus flocculans]|uniref:Uncharacterized protein n=1 Tax=Candidatus Moduliflexus flocculans TaxID=1499966 RepID=A0A0S6VT20_9BACT|nr:hypothetical protein U14_01899 [Candidatus Moduliflexus flocculans]